jgi:hypothetical protein
MHRFFSRFVAVALLALSAGSSIAPAYADTIFTPTSSREDLDLQNDKRSGMNRESYADQGFMHDIEGSLSSQFGNTFSYFTGSQTGERGAYALLLTVARDIKNVFILIAIVYLVISVLRILFSGGSDEQVKKWRNTILWTTGGIVLMQAAFVFVDTLYNRNVNGFSAMLFLDKLIYPFVHLLEMLASFAFLAMAFYAFFRIVTAG